jgi:seryl-tRNA synthetase
MIDPKLLRSAPEEVARLLARRGYVFDVSAWRGFEEQRRHWQIETDRLRAARNNHAKAVGQARGRGEDIAPLLAQAEELTRGLSEAEQQLGEVQAALERWQLDLPNLLHESVPDGTSRLAATAWRANSASSRVTMSRSANRSGCWISKRQDASLGPGSW